MNENPNHVFEKCASYCERLNKLMKESQTADDGTDSLCPDEEANFKESREDFILDTLQDLIEEKKEMKVIKKKIFTHSNQIRGLILN